MTTVRMVFDIDEDLRTEINIIAKRQKTTVKAIMNQLVEDFVRESNSSMTWRSHGILALIW